MQKDRNTTSKQFQVKTDENKANLMDTSRFFTQQSLMENSSPMINTMMNTTSRFFNVNHPEDEMSKTTMNRHSHRQTFIDPVGADQDRFTTNCFKNKFKKFDSVKANNSFH